MATLVPRIYSGFRGVDFRGEEVELVRSPDALNMWKDYRKTDSIRTRPAMERKAHYGKTVYGIFFFNGEMIVHSGDELYSIKGDVSTKLYTGLNEHESKSFVYEEVFYFKDGKHYLMYDGKNIKDVVGFIPTTSIARKPGGGGTIHQDVNYLSDYRKNTFLADGKSTDFYLDSMSIDADYVPVVRVDDAIVSTSLYTVDYSKGIIKFKTAPTAPLTDGQDNVSVQFKKHVDGYADTIKKCALLQVFDNRVFFSGNPDKPNVVWHCSLDDPSYCSDQDYYNEGLDKAEIRGLVAGNNALWVFREPSDANTTAFYHQPITDEVYGKIYPSVHSSVATGCIGRAINFNDDIVFFSDRGMEGISGDITTEQVVGHRSTMVDSKLLSEDGYRDMILEEWEGYLLVCIGTKIYLADSRTAFTNADHIEYEWFYWDVEKPITATRVQNGVLYIGTTDGVYTLTGDGAVHSYWVTPKDKFGYPHKLKTTNKRGCVAEATGDISVYAKLEDTGYEHINDYNGITDAFVSRIKRKKFKDIQLKFESSSRFSLESVTIEAFIGGYIKRI